MTKFSLGAYQMKMLICLSLILFQAALILLPAYGKEKINLKSLGVSKNAANRVMGEVPRPIENGRQKNIRFEGVCYDRKGRAYRSEDNSHQGKMRSYDQCLEGKSKDNYGESERNIEMKMGVDLNLK